MATTEERSDHAAQARESLGHARAYLAASHLHQASERAGSRPHIWPRRWR